MDAAGVISLNEDSVIGDLGTAANVKEYVDAKDDALAQSIIDEAAAREAGDTALGARIDALTESSENADTALAAQLADSIEAVNDQRGASDSALQLQISSNLNGINANTAAIADVDNKVVLLSDQSASGDEAVYESVVGMLQDSVTALEAADTALDDKFGSLTAPGQAASANVTDFVGLVTGNLGGVNVKTYSDAGDSVLGGQISALQDMDTTLGAQINERVAADAVQDGRLDALEADSVTATELADTVTALEAADAVQDGRLDALEADTISGGTGVTITDGEIAIGQDVATSEEVTFSKVTATNGVYADLVNAGGDVILDVSTGAVTGNASGVSYLEYASGSGGTLNDLTTAVNGNFAVDTTTSTVHIRVTGGWVQISN